MKSLLAAVILATATGAHAQQTFTLSWTASTDPTTTVNVYQSSTICPAPGAQPTSAFVKIAGGVAAGGPYSVPNLGYGPFCWYVTAVDTASKLESGPSNYFGNSFAVPAPTNLTGK